MSNPLQRAQELGQSIWYDNMRRGLLRSGELAKLIDDGVSGVTSNPTIFEKAIAGSTDYDQDLLPLAREGGTAAEVYEALAVKDIQDAADLLRPIYDRTQGVDGYASLEVSPDLAHDAEKTVAEARRLYAALDRPNVMIKAPATPASIPAIRTLIGEGMNINATLIFSLESYRQVAEAYIQGLEDLAEKGGDVRHVASVASFFISRVDTAVDRRLEELAGEDSEAGARNVSASEEARDLMGTAAVANARLAYEQFKEVFHGDRFARLKNVGARVQRPLWASTGTKNPVYSDLLYVESLLGAETVSTMPPATLTAFMTHGNATSRLDGKVNGARRIIERVEALGVRMHEVTDQLLSEGVEAFAASFDKLMANVEDKRIRLLAREREHSSAQLGEGLGDVESALGELERAEVLPRLWRGDHTVWKDDPTEITNRLGWLTVTDRMSEQTPVLEALARKVKDEGYRHVVLLGMGGSSLAPEVLRQTFGSAPGYPELLVLDSTVPSRVQAVTDAIDPATTLFLVSSKSGTTLEPLSYYKHFRALVEDAVGKEPAGRHFVAITDPGTPLGDMAREHGFRRTFANPPDIGGRYSALTYFGLVPAALMGIDLANLLDRADRMREGCASCVPVHENPGAWLGATIGALAKSGGDKLTLITSPGIAGFGLWVEQLIAESTGKEGRGIVPVAGEPLMEPTSYGDDRLFVYMRMEGGDNGETDAAVARLMKSGQPVNRINLRDAYDLGAEFFRWEMATAIAGAILGIHPFDQPNVQQAKDLTNEVLAEYQKTGSMPVAVGEGSLEDLLSAAKPGSYLAIMAYVRQTHETDEALSDLRRMIMERRRVATTLGYGPRFLHSTGQLHKGGPPTGVFLQLVEQHEKAIPIPGESYDFGALADAQALGDLRALTSLGRPVARRRLHADMAQAVGELSGQAKPDAGGGNTERGKR